MNFTNDIEHCLSVLKNGGLILYPTDTIWGIGGDATNEVTVAKIYALKNRADEKAMIILLPDENELIHYAHPIIPEALGYLNKIKIPTTVIYPTAKNLAKNLVQKDGSIAIRIVKDAFCKALITAFGKPLISTSANISGQPSPENFHAIDSSIKKGVDYIVQHRQHELTKNQPSSIIKFTPEGEIEVIR